MNNNDTQYAEYWASLEEEFRLRQKTEQEKMAEYSFNELTRR
jgi:hypothetical protein